MKLFVFSPYGNFSREAGLMYLIANYLGNFFPQVHQLRCNGLFAVCDRDVDSSWKRDAHNCKKCINDQGRLAEWAGIGNHSLSQHLLPEDIEGTKRWALALDDDQLITAQFDGVELFELCRESFKTRFGYGDPDSANKNHVRFAKLLLVNSARMCLAAERFSHRYGGHVAFVAGGRDYLSRSFIRKSQQHGGAPVVFELNLNARAVRVVHPLSHEEMLCDLLLEDIYLMRADYHTWPKELITIIEDVLVFLGLAETQLDLPIANR